MICFYFTKHGKLAVVEVDKIEVGQTVKLIKIIKGNFGEFIGTWTLATRKCYKELTPEEKLELL